MVKKEKLSLEKAEEIYKSTPEIVKGQWKTLCADVKKTGVPVQVSDITRGQAYALKRAAQEQGLRVKALEKGKKVIILPAEKEPAKK